MLERTPAIIVDAKKTSAKMKAVQPNKELMRKVSFSVKTLDTERLRKIAAKE